MSDLPSKMMPPISPETADWPPKPSVTRSVFIFLRAA